MITRTFFSLLFSLLFIVSLPSLLFCQATLITASPVNSKEIAFTLDHTAHLNFGCAYPVTFQVAIPSGQSGLIALRKFSSAGRWASLPEKTRQDFFNGIEAVRFDYANKTAYVSAAFASYTDTIFMEITDSTGSPVQISFTGICKYYDNRTAAVTVSCDDWSDWVVLDNRFSTLLNIFRQYHLYVTVGIITDQNNSSASTWNMMQQQLDLGYIEAASHSRSHPDTPYTDYNGEINGSYDDITGKLTLPALFSLGANKGYVYTWIAPYGSYNHQIDSMLQARHYLVSRLYSVGNPNVPSSTFSKWDTKTFHFEPNNPVVEIGAPSWGGGDSSLASLNHIFDSVAVSGGIYHFMWHPQVVYPDRNLPYFRNHLAYISNRNDIWYANLGHLYLYHMLQEAASIGTGVAEEIKRPNTFQLNQNYPNPFNPSTTISYELAQQGHVVIKLYDILGREIRVLVDANQAAGKHSLSFDAANLASGVYLYQLNCDGQAIIRKMVKLQ